MSRYRFALPALVLLLAAPGITTLGAQIAPLTVPKGWLRLDLSGSFASYDRRFLDGRTQDAAGDFIHNPAGRTLLPGLRTADSLLALVTGLGDAAVNLGETSASQLVVTGTGGLGLAYGLTRRITVFGYMPFVRVRVRSTFALDSTSGNAGANPAHPLLGTGNGQAQTQQFFAQFDLALTTLGDRLAAGDYDADPSRKALAQETLARGTALRDRLFALLAAPGSAALFLPTGTSVPGAEILRLVTALQGTIRDGLDISGFSQAPALPSQRVSTDAFRSFATNPAGLVAGSFDTPTVTSLGDTEVGAAVSFLDQYDAGTRQGYRVAAQGLVRLRTSRLDNPARFFDVGTGDRQPDVEVMATADLLRDRFGARALAGYTLQLPGRAERRIAPPDEPFPLASRLAAVERDPGDLVTLGLLPYVRMAPHFALTGGLVWRKKGLDDVRYADGQEPVTDIPVSVLAENSDMSWTTASLGLTFSAPFTQRDRAVPPLDAGIAWDGVIAASGGRVPKSSSFRFFLRIYRRL